MCDWCGIVCRRRTRAGSYLLCPDCYQVKTGYQGSGGHARDAGVTSGTVSAAPAGGIR